MLEIQERLDTVGYEQLREAAGSAKLHITEALDGDEVIGYIAYSYSTDRTVVYDYDDRGNMMLCDGLVRSVMLKSVLKGINHMLFQLPEEKKYDNLTRLRFIAKDSRQCADLESFMNSCQHCKG